MGSHDSACGIGKLLLSSGHIRKLIDRLEFPFLWSWYRVYRGTNSVQFEEILWNLSTFTSHLLLVKVSKFHRSELKIRNRQDSHIPFIILTCIAPTVSPVPRLNPLDTLTTHINPIRDRIHISNPLAYLYSDSTSALRTTSPESPLSRSCPSAISDNGKIVDGSQASTQSTTHCCY